ncbi:MAG TPA: L,D-transpeptidase family protein [Steroidobacteraceae bacterium]|nr:L,D-transpeptidase family protein [Steroidobacteraceae bacterium]
MFTPIPGPARAGGAPGAHAGRRAASLAAAALMVVVAAATTPAPTWAAGLVGTGAAQSDLPMADRVVVRKAERRLYLLRGDTVLRSYRVALGLNPVGQKEREGDSRTPEGHYYLTRRNPRSEYFLSIQVSYPNPTDLRRAHHRGWAPGGSIMVHGLPNELRREPVYYETRDWTDGCIAVSDADMLEIWLMTPPDVPIDILP